jgi:hypothetical protein
MGEKKNLNRHGAEERQGRISLFGVLRRLGGSIPLLLLSLLALACNDERRYVGDPQVVQVAITGETMPALASEEAAVFIVEQRIELPIREPSETVLADLQTAAGKYEGLPFPRMPWVSRDDLAVSVDFALYNLDADSHDVTVTLNGFNEFDEYVPGVNVVDDEVVIDFSQWERLYRLEGKQRLARTIREEELDEAAVDLATVVNGAPSSNQVVYFENLSDRDPRSRMFIPKVVPGLGGFRIGLRTTEAGNVLLEATVKVREAEDRLADDDDDVFMMQPEPFMPVNEEAEE